MNPLLNFHLNAGIGTTNFSDDMNNFRFIIPKEFKENENFPLDLDPVEYRYIQSIDYLPLVNPDSIAIDEEGRRRMQLVKAEMVRYIEEYGFKCLIGGNDV